MKFNGKIWTISDKDGRKLFGKGPYTLLKFIDETGSLNQAAKKMKMSYSKAFNVIKDCEEGIGKALLIREIGGAKGGGSELTNEGKKLMEIYEDAERRFEEFLETLDYEI